MRPHVRPAPQRPAANELADKKTEGRDPSLRETRYVAGTPSLRAFVLRFACLLAALTLATPGFAQSPVHEQIPYQGVLSDSGTPLPDGPKPITFSLSDGNGGTWSETASVTTTDGLFSHRLGSVVALSGIDFSTTVQLTVAVPAGPSSTIQFTSPLGATPMAHRAMSAETSEAVAFPLEASASTFSTGGATLSVENTGNGDAIRVPDAGVAFSAVNAGMALEALTTSGYGIYIGEAGYHGLNVNQATQIGVRIRRSGEVGIHIGATGDLDFNSEPDPDRTFDGVIVHHAGGNGFRVLEANRSGFEATQADRHGLLVSQAGEFGIRATGDDGNYVETAATATQAPDLILGGLSGSASGDNGVIASDPRYSSSDLFGISNDAVLFVIDSDEDSDTGEFEIKNGAGTLLWSVEEGGTVTSGGPSLHAASSVLIDDPAAPSSRTLSLPSVVSDDRMVAFSGNVTTDGSGRAVVTLPAYAEAIAEDFRYQLTVIGSFAQAIVGEKVAGGRFAIRTSAPGIEVSWRIEGVRQDAWAEANAHVAVAQKAQPGTYIHPEAFGASPTQAALTSSDPDGQVTPEGQIQLDAQAADAERMRAFDAEVQREADARDAAFQRAGENR